MSYIYLHEPNSIFNGSGYLDFLYRIIFINLENMVGYVMNQQDRKEFEIVHLKIDDLRNDIVELKESMKEAHTKTDESLKFIKENLFDPNKGLWAETKLNTQFRDSANKWRGMIGMGFVALLIERVYNLLIGS